MEEMLDLVNDNDEIIGQIKRSESRGIQNVRVINIFIKTPDDKLIVPLRSANRRIYPNCYDFSVGGFVDSGDSYGKTAHKELEEELGVSDMPLQEIGYFKPKDKITISFSKLYLGKYDGRMEDLQFDKDGIQQLYTFSNDEIIKMLKETPEKFKGDFKQSFEYYLENVIKRKQLK